jgi:Fe-S-cluster containining protein
MIKQIIPQEFCLKCRGCCRFKALNSAWSPCLLEEEVQDMLDKDIPAASISANRKLIPVSDPAAAEGFICPFLDAQENKCKIYGFRPFECQLYPFLIDLRGKKVILTLDLNCPYVSEHLKDDEFRKYIDSLASFLNSPAQLKVLKDNPQIIQAYEEVLDIMELELPDET